MLSARLIQWSGLAAIVGGVLWMVYGVFEMVEPWGRAVLYRPELGYELVTNAPLYRVYSLPGSVALFLTALGLLGVAIWCRLPVGRLGKLGVVLASTVVGVAVLSALGVLILFVPLFFAGVVLGSFILGAATFLLAVDARNVSVPSPWTTALLALGIMGLLLLPLRPLVFAVALIPPGVAAGFIALFGLGWLAAGFRLWLESRQQASGRWSTSEIKRSE
ncbi:MAG: hypothetical protein M3220_13705 [Chloroflexota bacterium]|nr:hypothetical protein [Chloroflexota bacterium]